MTREEFAKTMVGLASLSPEAEWRDKKLRSRWLCLADLLMQQFYIAPIGETPKTPPHESVVPQARDEVIERIAAFVAHMDRKSSAIVALRESAGCESMSKVNNLHREIARQLLEGVEP